MLDEIRFYRLEGWADSDAEIQASVRRGMLSFPTPRLVKVSTPFMRSGVLYEDFKRAWAQPDPAAGLAGRIEQLVEQLLGRAPTVNATLGRRAKANRSR